MCFVEPQGGERNQHYWVAQEKQMCSNQKKEWNYEPKQWAGIDKGKGKQAKLSDLTKGWKIAVDEDDKD